MIGSPCIVEQADSVRAKPAIRVVTNDDFDTLRRILGFLVKKDPGVAQFDGKVQPLCINDPDPVLEADDVELCDPKLDLHAISVV